jgi:hypothetical protein
VDGEWQRAPLFSRGLFVSAPLACVLANSTGIFHLSFSLLFAYVCANALSIRQFVIPHWKHFL